MYQLHLHNALKWDPNEDLGFMLALLIGDVFTVHFADCHFNENVFLSSGGEKLIPEERREITWNASTMSHLDPCTS